MPLKSVNHPMLSHLQDYRFHAFPQYLAEQRWKCVFLTGHQKSSFPGPGWKLLNCQISQHRRHDNLQVFYNLAMSGTHRAVCNLICRGISSWGKISKAIIYYISIANPLKYVARWKIDGYPEALGFGFLNPEGSHPTSITDVSKTYHFLSSFVF